MRIEEQGKKLKLMFDPQQKTNKSAIETPNSSNKARDDPNSTNLEDVQVFPKIDKAATSTFLNRAHFSQQNQEPNLCGHIYK